MVQSERPLSHSFNFSVQLKIFFMQSFPSRLKVNFDFGCQVFSSSGETRFLSAFCPRNMSDHKGHSRHYAAPVCEALCHGIHTCSLGIPSRKHLPTSGPLCSLCPLPRMHYPSISAWLAAVLQHSGLSLLEGLSLPTSNLLPPSTMPILFTHDTCHCLKLTALSPCSLPVEERPELSC